MRYALSRVVVLTLTVAITGGVWLSAAPSLCAQELKERLSLKGGRCVLFSHDGNTIATIGADGLDLFDSNTGARKQTLKTAVNGMLYCSVAFSPDDQLLAVGKGFFYHGDIDVWKVPSGELLWQQTDVLGVHHVPVIFSADGKSLISPEQATSAHVLKEREKLPAELALSFWDAATGKRSRIITGGNRYVAQLAVSADGKQLLSATSIQVELWDVPAGKRSGKVTIKEAAIVALGFAADKTAAVGLQDRVEFWNVAEGKLLRTIKTGEGCAVAFSADGTLLACATSKEVKLWDTQTGDLKVSLPLANMSGVALSPDRKTLATLNADGLIQLWDIARIVDRGK